MLSDWRNGFADGFYRIWAWIFIPECAGLSLEQIDYLFKLKWYKIGTQGRKEAEREVEVDNERWQQTVGEKAAKGEEVEYVADGERKV